MEITTFHASTQAVNLSSVAIAADLNGDGISDIVTGGSVATVLLGSQRRYIHADRDPESYKPHYIINRRF